MIYIDINIKKGWGMKEIITCALIMVLLAGYLAITQHNMHVQSESVVVDDFLPKDSTIVDRGKSYVIYDYPQNFTSGKTLAKLYTTPTGQIRLAVININNRQIISESILYNPK